MTTTYGPHSQPHPEPKSSEQEWRCKECGAWHVVPTLARDCERTHR